MQVNPVFIFDVDIHEVTSKMWVQVNRKLNKKIKNGGPLHGCSPFFIHGAHLRQGFMNKIHW